MRHLFLLILLHTTFSILHTSVVAAQTVNLPSFGTQSRMDKAAIFWFGQVDNTNNYADIRLGYTDTHLKIYLHIMDRYLWYNPQGGSDVTDYDAVTLLVTPDSNTTTISPHVYKFTIGLRFWEPYASYEAAFQGTSNGTWQPMALSNFSESGWRGNAPNDLVDDRGWTAFFMVPFNSLNQASPPSTGNVWKAALILHDRDNNTAAPLPVKTWPPSASSTNPSTWATLHFGLPSYTPPNVTNPTTITLRQGITPVTDAHVGGHGNCGADASPEFFPTWGSLNYAGYSQITEQNQWDISDWPCFSKMLINFDVNTLPPNKTITNASLVLHQFGNSDPSGAKPSYIQVLTTSTPWQESNLTWNNAPPAIENISAAWVNPESGTLAYPGWRREWDVTYGLAKTYAAHQTSFPIILYSADGDYHSGKYFFSSEEGEWNTIGRPTLLITLGDAATSPNPYDPDNDGDIDFVDLWLLLSHPFTIFDYNQIITKLPSFLLASSSN